MNDPYRWSWARAVPAGSDEIVPFVLMWCVIIIAWHLPFDLRNFKASVLATSWVVGGLILNPHLRRICAVVINLLTLDPDLFAVDVPVFRPSGAVTFWN